MVIFRFLYHTKFLVCVFNVCLKKSIRTGAVCSFNFLRILPLVLFGSLVLCALILCRSFCTPGRYIGSVGFRMWILVQSGMLSCGSKVNTDWHCLLRMLNFYFVSAVICPSLLLGVMTPVLCQLWSVHRSSLVWWHLCCLYVRIL